MTSPHGEPLENGPDTEELTVPTTPTKTQRFMEWCKQPVVRDLAPGVTALVFVAAVFIWQAPITWEIVRGVMLTASLNIEHPSTVLKVLAGLTAAAICVMIVVSGIVDFLLTLLGVAVLCLLTVHFHVISEALISPLFAMGYFPTVTTTTSVALVVSMVLIVALFNSWRKLDERYSATKEAKPEAATPTTEPDAA